MSDKITYRKKIPAALVEQIRLWSTWRSVEKYNFTCLRNLMSMGGVDIHTLDCKLKTKKGNNDAKKELDGLVAKFCEENDLGFLLYTRGATFLYDDEGLLGYIDTNYRSVYADIYFFGSLPLIEPLKKFIETNFEEEKVHLMKELYLTVHGAVSTSPAALDVCDPDQTNSFYPFLQQTPKEWWKSFDATDAGLALLVGPPGTGKSNFIKCLVNARDNIGDIYFCSDQETILHPKLIDELKAAKSGSLVIFEDADQLLGKREQGNTLMANLLNILSGLVRKDHKFILSTNKPNLKMVDEALLRPGRTHSILKFEKLTAAQAQTARETANKPFLSLPTDKEYTLAEALNWDEGNASQIQAFGPGF